MSDGSIIIDSRIDSKQLEKDLKTMEKSLKKVGKGFEDTGKKLTKGLTLPLAGVGVGLSKAAMDLEATEAKFEVVFDGMTDQADDFIKEFQKLTPATTAEARSMASGIQDLLVPMGFAREEATQMTAEMFHLIGALTNFNSATHSAEDVASAFQSAMTGSTEPLKRLGIQVNQTTIEQKALEMGLMAAGEEMTQQVRAQALLALSYEQSGDALAGYNEESLDTMTKMGLMKAEAIDVAASFGQILLPAIASIVESLRGFVDWLGALSVEQQEQIIRAMLVAAALGPLLIILGKLITAVSTVTTTLMAMNPWVLAIIAVVAALTAVITYLWQENEVFREKVIEIWEFIKEFFMVTFEIITILFETTMEFLKTLWDMWGQTILEITTLVFTAISTFLTITFEVIRVLFETTIEFLTTLWDAWGETLLNVATFIFEAISSVIEVVFEVIKTIFEVVIDFITLMWEAWGELLFETIKVAFELIKEIIDITLKLITEIIKITIGIIEAIWDKFGKYIIAAWEIWWGTMKDVVSVVFGVISGIIESALGLIKGVFDVFIGLVTGDWSRMWEGMANIIKSSANVIITIVNAIIGAVEALINAVGRAVNAIPSFSIPSWVPGIGGKRFGLPNIPRVNLPKLPSFDVGTDRITRDGLAMVHRDEMVVPAKSTGPFTGKGMGGNIEQNITINSPTPLSPNEIKQKLQEQSRRMALEWR